MGADIHDHVLHAYQPAGERLNRVISFLVLPAWGVQNAETDPVLLDYAAAWSVCPVYEVATRQAA